MWRFVAAEEDWPLSSAEKEGVMLLILFRYASTADVAVAVLLLLPLEGSCIFRLFSSRVPAASLELPPSLSS